MSLESSKGAPMLELKSAQELYAHLEKCFGEEMTSFTKKVPVKISRAIRSITKYHKVALKKMWCVSIVSRQDLKDAGLYPLKDSRGRLLRRIIIDFNGGMIATDFNDFEIKSKLHKEGRVQKGKGTR